MKGEAKAKKQEKINKIIDLCKYEEFEKTENIYNGTETVKRFEKLDMKKFRTTYFSQSVKDDINDEIVLTRMRKEIREMKEELDVKTGANKKGKKMISEKAAEEANRLAEKMREAKKKQMEMKYAGIDRKAK